MLIKPHINLNGMTADQHIRLRLKAREKLRALQEALSELRPHGRDYIGYHADYERDLAIWSERYAATDKLYNELTDECFQIDS